MKNKKIILYACLIALLSGCGKSGSRYAFFVYDGNDTFINEIMGCITSQITQNISFVIHNAGNSQSVQNQQIVEHIDSNINLFVINAVDRLACSSIVEKCSKKGIPIIFFNREPLEDALINGKAFYVGAAADSLGEKQADMVANLFTEQFDGSKFDKNGDGAIQLVILKGEQGHQDAEKRTENCVKRLKEHGFEIDLLSTVIADWKRQNAYEAMKLLYSQYGDDIELVFANNDDMALGAIDYLVDANIFSINEEGYDQPIVIVGVDGTAVGLEAISKGLLYGTVHNDFAKQANVILTLADYILKGQDFEDFPYNITKEHYIYVDGDIITKVNLADYSN